MSLVVISTAGGPVRCLKLCNSVANGEVLFAFPLVCCVTNWLCHTVVLLLICEGYLFNFYLENNVIYHLYLFQSVFTNGVSPLDPMSSYTFGLMGTEGVWGKSKNENRNNTNDIR